MPLLRDRPVRRRLPQPEKTARIRLERLAAATLLRDLELPGWRLAAPQGDRLGQYRIGTNDQFRICFPRRDGDAENGERVDGYGRKDGYAHPANESGAVAHPPQ